MILLSHIFTGCRNLDKTISVEPSAVPKFESINTITYEPQETEHVSIGQSAFTESKIIGFSQEFSPVSSTDTSSKSTEKIDCESNIFNVLIVSLHFFRYNFRLI